MPGIPPLKLFSTAAALQDFLLKEAGPGDLVVVPHQRLAQQLWQRQRRGQLQAGRPAWEPLPLVTLQGWLHDLYQSLWSEVALAPDLQRLSLWLQAIKATPALSGTNAELPWAQALDETYNILCRHSLMAGGDARPTGDARPQIRRTRAPDRLAAPGYPDFQATAGGGRLAGAGRAAGLSPGPCG